MGNVFDDMRTAVSTAKYTLQAADRVADDMAELLRGRLRHVSVYRLQALKRELRDFDMHKKEWKP